MPHSQRVPLSLRLVQHAKRRARSAAEDWLLSTIPSPASALAASVEQRTAGWEAVASRRRNDQLTQLARVRLQDVPQLVPLSRSGGCNDDPRLVPQGSDAWFAQRAGSLTGSSFSEALNFHGDEKMRLVWRQLADGQHRRVAGFIDERNEGAGCEWGRLHERSALATYLTAWLLPRCDGARVLETGFWPIETRADCAVDLGASPDALLEGAESICSGGVIVEVKCPYRSGSPRAQRHVYARQLPQIQGMLLATGRQSCHLVSWSPTGCSVFDVQGDPAYQGHLVDYLCSFATAAITETWPLSSELREQAEALRAHSAQLARRAGRIGHIEASNCLQYSGS